MPSLRIATFNCENLFMRCDFTRTGLANPRERLTAVSDPAQAAAVDAAFNVLSEDDRTLTAQALGAARAEVCALQEVENLVTLTAFDTRYLARWSDGPHAARILHEGNDGRGIDVALLSRLPVLAHRSHAHETFRSLGTAPPPGTSPDAKAFRRDCLECVIAKDGRALTVFVCHFKSMHGGRRRTRAVRQAEARAVRAIVERRFAHPADAEWLILGDLNDYAERDGTPLTDHGLGPLIDDGFAIDLAPRLVDAALERWTHHYPGDDTYGALDHMLASPALAARNTSAPMKMIRCGLPWRASRHTGYRLPGIGWIGPKASDHCPLAATLEFEGEPAGPYT